MVSASQGQSLGQGRKTILRAPIPLLTVAAFLIAFLPGCKKGGKVQGLIRGGNFNLLLISVDSLRIDRIGAYGSGYRLTPNIDSLAEKGVMFESCYASVPLSLPSHCTVFTGREPPVHGVRNDTDVLPPSEVTWAEVMKNRGFETYALVSSYLLHSQFGLKQGFDTYDDSLDYAAAGHNVRTAVAADRIFARFEAWIERAASPRFFAWVHFSDPQAPYEPPPDYVKKSGNDPYGAEVALVDQYIGELVLTLEKRKLLDRTVIAFIGSHGESLHEHREWGHGLFCYEPTLRVPLIVHNPAVFKDKLVVSSRVRLLDLMPSLLQLFDVETPAGIQGRSFFHMLSGRSRDPQKDPTIYFESLYGLREMGFAPLTGLIRENFKYISLPEPELYDLKSDPAETDNLVHTNSSAAKQMDADLRRMIDEWSGQKPGEGRKAEPDGEFDRLVDPKKGISALERMIEVERLVNSGQWTEAEEELRRIRAEFGDWNLPQVYDYQYLLDRRINDLPKTEKTLRQAVENFPGNVRFRLLLAQFYFSTQRLEEAEQTCLEALAGNPRLSQAHILLATVHRKSGRIAHALACLENALDREPQNIRLRLEQASLLADLGERAKSLEILKSLMQNRSLAADPAGPDVQAEIGGLMMEIGEYETASTLLLDLVAAGKGSSRVWTQIGLGYFNRGDLAKARESLEKALSLNPGNAIALSSLGTFHLSLFKQGRQKEDLEKAIDFYSRAKEASPEFVAAVNGLGVAVRFAGDLERAISCWRRVLEIDPGFTDAYFNLGITLIDTGRKREALGVLSACKLKYADRLNERERRQLDSLIQEAK